MQPQLFRRFIDGEAIFEITVPFDWRYNLHDDRIHTFDSTEIWNDTSFQISISSISESEKSELAKLLGYLPQIPVEHFDLRERPDEVDETEEGCYVTKIWNTIIGNELILFTCTYETVLDKKMYKRLEEEKLPTVFQVISSFRLLTQEFRERELNSYRFEMFLQGIGATNTILKRAFDNKAFIEATCLLSNQIDSLLRIAVVLKLQLLNGNDVIEKEWIYQGRNDKKKSEKDVYKKSKDLGIINGELFDELFVLYEDRNRVIHRFIISEITLAEVESISHSYYKIRERIKVIVDDIESEQIKSGIGMVTLDQDDPGNKSNHLRDNLSKIGSLNYFVEEK